MRGDVSAQVARVRGRFNEDADDAAQEVALFIFNENTRGRNPDDQTVFERVRRKLENARRADKRHKALALRAAQGATTPKWCASRPPSPAAVAIRHLDTLPCFLLDLGVKPGCLTNAQLRVVSAMWRHPQLTNDAVAKRLGVTEGAVRCVLRKIREKSPASTGSGACVTV